MKQLMTDLQLAIMLSGIISLAVKSSRQGLENSGFALNGKQAFIYSIIVGTLVSLVFNVYYLGFTLVRTVVITFLSTIGAQGIYDFLSNFTKANDDEDDTHIDKIMGDR